MQFKFTRPQIAFILTLAFTLLTFIPAVPAAEDIPKRENIDDKYKWDLSQIYPDWETWESDLAKLEKMMGEYTSLQGTLAGGADNLARAYKLGDELDKLAYKVFRYPQLARALDNRDNELAGRLQQVQILYSRFGVATAWFTPELLAIPWESLHGWMVDNEELAPYRFNIENLLRQQEHVLDENQERLLSYFAPANSTPQAAYNELTTSDVKYGRTEFGDGDSVTVTPGVYYNILATNRNQNDRARAFETFYSVFEANANTYAALYNGVLQRDWAQAQARNYNSCLEAAVDGDNIPVEVVENLVSTVKAGTAPLQKYYRLRQKVLGLEDYHGYDASIPIVEYEKTYEYDDVAKWIIESVAPLGKDYQNMVREALNDNWIDVYETDGKSTGAYSASVYGVHPFILMNYNKTLDNVFTLAHELGHAMHTMLADKHQPKATADYSLFVAEVASTLNEALLLDYLLEHSSDPRERITLLQHAINNIEGTFYTQVLFADFEMEAHRMVEQGQPITADVLSDLYARLWQEQHGETVAFDDKYKVTWTRIGHFYWAPYYVYKYATSFAASAQLHNQIISPDKKVREVALERYLTLLKSGGSDYPIALLQKAGVDMTKSEPIQAVIDQLDYLVGRLKSELAEL
ncbi:MAG: oligoendopeptidase F [Candidatus Zixiibacteriota bacterium]